MAKSGPRTLAARERAAREVRRALVADPPQRVVLLVPDPHARFAAVELDGAFTAEHVLTSGYGACTYLFAWDVERQPVEAPALAPYLGGYGDLLLWPDLASLRPIEPIEPIEAVEDGAAAVVCDARWPDGSPVEVAPRHVLRRQLAAAEELGLVPSVGIEHEVTFTDAAGAPLTRHGVDYAVGGTERLEPLLRDIRGALRAAELGVESARAECHPGQYEIVPRHRDTLAACDDAMLAQLLIRRAAARHGVHASYLAAEQPGQGSSCHVHLSLSTLDGRPRGGGVLFSFLAGVLRAAGDLTAIFAPTVNSYVRLRTSPFTPRLVRWGVDDRTAAVRLAGRGDSLRLECRFAGADAQPHLVVAAILAAGLAGVRDGATAPPAGTVLDELAATPWQALSRLTSGQPAALLGPIVIDHQAVLLSAELDASCDAVTDWQRRRGALRS